MVLIITGATFVLLFLAAAGTLEATQPTATRRWSRVGLQRNSQIITSAALLILVVIGLFSVSGVTLIKPRLP
jgi:hypothetical protein